jgi:hydrogenase nickel incorporation protein HypA/HybF
MSLIDTIEATAARDGIARVSAVYLRVGALTGIAPDALRFSWEAASAKTVVEGSELRIETVPLAVFCDGCAAERSPRPGTGLLCPVCERVCATIVHGRELQLVGVEVLDEISRSRTKHHSKERDRRCEAAQPVR